MKAAVQECLRCTLLVTEATYPSPAPYFIFSRKLKLSLPCDHRYCHWEVMSFLPEQRLQPEVPWWDKRNVNCPRFHLGGKNETSLSPFVRLATASVTRAGYMIKVTDKTSLPPTPRTPLSCTENLTLLQLLSITLRVYFFLADYTAAPCLVLPWVWEFPPSDCSGVYHLLTSNSLPSKRAWNARLQP